MQLKRLVLIDIYSLQCALRERFYLMGLKTSSSISERVGVPQSTVYRNLYTRKLRVTSTIKKLCIYADIEYMNYSKVDPKSNDCLMGVLSQVWDGSDKHAQEIRKLLLSAHSCRMRKTYPVNGG